MKEKTEIRFGKTTDIPAVLSLIRELAIYEKAADEVTITEKELLEDGFGENPVYEILIAENLGEIIGIALFYTKYSTWKGKSIHLEDLVVKEEMRRNGIGERLFEAVMKITHKRKYQRMEWQVLGWNEPAINFYKKFNANLDSEWINGRLTFDQLQQKFANK